MTKVHFGKIVGRPQFRDISWIVYSAATVVKPSCCIVCVMAAMLRQQPVPEASVCCRSAPISSPAEWSDFFQEETRLPPTKPDQLKDFVHDALVVGRAIRMCSRQNVWHY